jgi:hypothetical protein
MVSLLFERTSKKGPDKPRYSAKVKPYRYFGFVVSDKLVCVKRRALEEDLEIEPSALDGILESLLNQGFVTKVRIDDETGYCLTESGQEYTEDWLRSLDVDVNDLTVEYLVEMLESTAPPDRQS